MLVREFLHQIGDKSLAHGFCGFARPCSKPLSEGVDDQGSCMHQLEKARHRIVTHVHDENFVETAIPTVDEICNLMATTPD